MRKLVVTALSMLLSLLVVGGTAWGQADVQKAALSTADCVKCHEQQPMEIEAKGGAHKTDIDCQACHEAHRPAVANNIPACSMCHSGEQHYELEGCSSCHNPHQPLEVTLQGDITGPCLSCHAAQGEELAAKPSMHGEVSCTFCHSERHGRVPECGECHEPHSDQMTQSDCRVCHQAHQPLTLTYGQQTASVLCASCHQTPFEQLAASEAKHRDVACVSCHQDQHKMTPQCADCHGKPHAEGMHQKFPNCGDCHNIAHDLNNWPVKKDSAKK